MKLHLEGQLAERVVPHGEHASVRHAVPAVPSGLQLEALGLQRVLNQENAISVMVEAEYEGIGQRAGDPAGKELR